MDVVLKFIGIILLVANSDTAPTKYDVYIPDGRIPQKVCKETVPAHLPAIRIKAAGVTWSNWTWIRCNDGRDCRLFLLEHDHIEIDGITSGGVITTGAFTYVPHFRDQMGVEALIPPTESVSKSAGWLTLSNGTITDDFLANDMRYMVLTTPFASQGAVTIKSNQKSITIPAQSRIEIEFINLPQAQAMATLGSSHDPDYRHFLLHYLYADKNNQKCGTPTQHTMTSPAMQRRLIAAGRTTIAATPLHAMDDGGNIQSGLAGNADCSASTWP